MEKHCYIFMTFINVPKNQIFQKIWCYCFYLFFFMPPNSYHYSEDKINTKSHICEVLWYYNIFKEKYRCPHRWTENISQKISKYGWFSWCYLKFLQISCVLPSNLCMTGELWPSQFIWHQNFRVHHCQSSFVFMQHSFCNSFRHCLKW